MSKLNAWVMLSEAIDGVRIANVHAKPDAVLSHYGFRSSSLEQWNEYRRVLAQLGKEHVTVKPDLRHVMFINLGSPYVVDGQPLRYLELPEPKVLRNGQQHDDPERIAVYTHRTHSAEEWVDGHDIRHTPWSADIIIARSSAGRE